jgi:Phage integrase, N-terminal SAM-like domain
MDPKHATPGTLVTTARHGQGKRWMARWVDHDGQERTKAFDRKAEAERHRVEITTQLTTGTYADPRRGAVTFGTVADPWFNSKSGLKPKTRAGYRSLLDVVVIPRWGEIPSRDITHADIQAWVHTLATDPESRQRKAPNQSDDDAKGLSAARVVQAYQVVDQVLRYAVRARYISLNPADDVQLPRIKAPEKIALTHDQVREIADASGELRTMVYVLGYGGLRYGEIAALRVGDGDSGSPDGDGGRVYQDSPITLGPASRVCHGPRCGDGQGSLPRRACVPPRGRELDSSRLVRPSARQGLRQGGTDRTDPA